MATETEQEYMTHDEAKALAVRYLDELHALADRLEAESERVANRGALNAVVWLLRKNAHDLLTQFIGEREVAAMREKRKERRAMRDVEQEERWA